MEKKIEKLYGAQKHTHRLWEILKCTEYNFGCVSICVLWNASIIVLDCLFNISEEIFFAEIKVLQPLVQHFQ